MDAWSAIVVSTPPRVAPWLACPGAFSFVAAFIKNIFELCPHYTHVLCFLCSFLFIFFYTFFLSTNVVHQHILLRVVVRPSALDARLTRFVKRRVRHRRPIALRVLPKWGTTWLLWISSLVQTRQMTVSARRVILMLVPTMTREMYEALIRGALFAQKVLTVRLLVQILE